MAISMVTKVSIQNLDLLYNDFQALRGISLEILESQITASIGSSGYGKSTCLGTSNCMNDMITGCRIEEKVSIDKEGTYDPHADTNLLRRRVGMMLQKPNLFPMSVYDSTVYGPRVHGVKSKSQFDQIVEKLFHSAALRDEVKDRLKKSALGLSGGQQQHLRIARVLVVDPDILLMDEPTSVLDPISTQGIEDLLDRLRDQYAAITVTHNMRQATYISDRTTFFLLGEVMEFIEARLMFEQSKDERTRRYVAGRFG